MSALRQQLSHVAVQGRVLEIPFSLSESVFWRRRTQATEEAISTALCDLGISASGVVRKRTDGSRAWPHGVNGSVSHKRNLSVVALCRRSYGPLGIDIEYRDSKLEDIADLIGAQCIPVGIPRETALLTAFSAKEAVFKAQFPLTGERLEFEDVSLIWSDATRAMATCLDYKFTVRAWSEGRWVATSATGAVT